MSPAAPPKKRMHMRWEFRNWIGKMHHPPPPRLIQVAVLFFPLPPKRRKEGRKRPLRTEKLSPPPLSVHLFRSGGRRKEMETAERRERRNFFIRPEAKKGASFSTVRVMEGYTVDRDYHFIDRSRWFNSATYSLGSRRRRCQSQNRGSKSLLLRLKD